MSRIVVIGAGIIGISCAFIVQRKGHDVVLIDPLSPTEACSFGNAGSLEAGSITPLATPGVLHQFAASSPIAID